MQVVSWQSLRDRLLLSDPGFVRLDTAARTTAAVATTTFIIQALANLWSGAQDILLIGAIASWLSAIIPAEPVPAQQRITAALVPLPAIAGVTLGTFAAGNPWREDPLFLAVLFVAVYIRRYGARYVAFGMGAALSYFFSLFIGTTPSQLPAVIGALLIGTGVTYVLRFGVFAKRVRGSRRLALQAILAEERTAIEQSARRLRDGSSALERISVLARDLAQTNETMLALEESGLIVGSGEELAFDCELAAEHLIVATFNASEGNDAAHRAAECEVRATMERVESFPQEPLPAHTPSPQRDAIREEAQHAPAVPGRLRPTTRQAIQVTVAAAAAMVVGEHLSSQRWYWAVLSAFIVFSGTTSLGETLARAWARFFGTTVGVLAGAVVGLLVGHNGALALGLLFLSMFFAAYFLRTAYGAASFFITTMVVMLYTLLGRFTEQILLLRFLETLVGAAFGGCAALILLPIPTQRLFRAEVLEMLAMLAAALVTFGHGNAPEAMIAARRCDAAMRRLRHRLNPLRSGPTSATFATFARRWIWGLELCAYDTRDAARTVDRANAQSLSSAIGDATAALTALQTAIDADNAWPRHSSAVPALDLPPVGESNTVRSIAAMATRLNRLADISA